MNFRKYYYLLYKLRTNSTLWIVDESVYIEDLIDRIKDFQESDDEYYIVSKKITEETIKSFKFKRFKTFNYNNHCKLEYITN